MDRTVIDKIEKRGVIPRSAFYSHISKYAKEAIECLIHLMNNSRNESVRLGAAKVILNKCLPDLKAEAIYDNIDNKILIEIIEEKSSNN